MVVEMPAKQPFFELRDAGAVTAIFGLLAVVLATPVTSSGSESAGSPRFVCRRWCYPFRLDQRMRTTFTGTTTNRCDVGGFVFAQTSLRARILGAFRVLLRPGRGLDDPPGPGGGHIGRGSIACRPP